MAFRDHERGRDGGRLYARAVIAAILIGASLGGCAGSASTSLSPTLPASPGASPTATAGTVAMVTCGGASFPASGLEAPAGAEKAPGPMYDALRAAIAGFGSEFPGASTWSWRLAWSDAGAAVFLARTDALGPPGWVIARVSADATGWHPTGMGQCDPLVTLSLEFGPATWVLDPAFPAPRASTTELHLLVSEVACSGGIPADGRVSDPVIVYGVASVTISIGVRPLPVPSGMAVTCPGVPGTPVVVELAQPLATRTLLDGGRVPPAPVSSPAA